MPDIIFRDVTSVADLKQRVDAFSAGTLPASPPPSPPPPPPSPPASPPPPPPSPPTLLPVQVTLRAPTFSSATAPPGTVIADLQGALSDGSPYTGIYQFDPNATEGGNPGGIFALVQPSAISNNPTNKGQLIVRVDGPGVGNVTTIDRVFVEAVQ